MARALGSVKWSQRRAEFVEAYDLVHDKERELSGEVQVSALFGKKFYGIELAEVGGINERAHGKNGEIDVLAFGQEFADLADVVGFYRLQERNKLEFLLAKAVVAPKGLDFGDCNAIRIIGIVRGRGIPAGAFK